jgi:hypothetical protein
MHFCGNCQKPVPKSAGQCPYCGVRLSGTRQASADERASIRSEVAKQVAENWTRTEKRRRTQVALARIESIKKWSTRLTRWTPRFVHSPIAGFACRRLVGFVNGKFSTTVRSKALWAYHLCAYEFPGQVRRVLAPRVEEIIAVLQDRDLHKADRIAAALALGVLKDEKAIEPLVAVLGSRDPGGSAANALQEIGPAAVGALVNTLGNKSWLARKRAAWALGEIGDMRAAEPLIDALDDEKREVREAVTKALQALGIADADG